MFELQRVEPQTHGATGTYHPPAPKNATIRYTEVEKYNNAT
jgi:hypothetical protein